MQEKKNKVLHIGIPASIILVLTSFYNLVEFLLIRSQSGQRAAIVGYLVPVQFITQAIGFSLSMGVGTVVAKKAEEKKNEGIVVGYITMLLGMVLGGTLMLALLLFPEQVLVFLGANRIMPENSFYGEAMGYVRWTGAAIPFYIGAVILAAELRGFLKTSLSMWIQGVSLVFGMGAAIGMVLFFNQGLLGIGIPWFGSFFFAFIIQGAVFLKEFGVPGHEKALSDKSGQEKKYLDKADLQKDIKEVLQLGMSGLARQGSAALAAYLVNYFSKPYGEMAVTGMNLVARIYMIPYSWGIGMAQALQTIAAQKKDMRKEFRQAGFYITTGLIVAGGILWLVGKYILPHKIEMRALQLQALAFPFLGFPVMCNMVYQGKGNRYRSTGVAALRQGLLYVPAILVGVGVFGMAGIMASQPLADIVTFAVMLPCTIKMMKGKY